MAAEGLPDRNDPPSAWLSVARHVVIESDRADVDRRMDRRGNRTTWFVNGREVERDAASLDWRARMLEALDLTWELAMLRARVTSLLEDIASIEVNRGKSRQTHSPVSSASTSETAAETRYRNEIAAANASAQRVRERVAQLGSNDRIADLRAQIAAVNTERIARDLDARLAAALRALER